MGFTRGFIFNGPGNDLFIGEIGNASERAQIYISDMLSTDINDFIAITDIANGNRINEYDFEDFSEIPDDYRVRAVWIEGLDNNGSSPGFDLTLVQGLEGSSAEIPLPAGLPLLAGGLAGMALLRRARKG